uniref:Saposin n=1 Tax=Anopheles atroparvus TaxID=41427 RepID=A0AAG5DVS2_ANOAO
MGNRILAVASIMLLASAVVLSSPVKQTTGNPSSNKRLLGAKECTWGPSYWCSDIKNAKSCGAVSHCIQTVWEKQQYPVDNDEICNICLDMVKQARDQLESNETQADLKAVFEGSCNLIPVKVVKKECRKLADDFIPELVEALASQMNPNVVCSVAGLCNNAEIDRLLAAQPATKRPTVEAAEDSEDDEQGAEQGAADDGEFTCAECGSIAGHIVSRFRATDRDRVLEGFLRVCGQMSSYSDGCASLVLTNFGELYGHLSRHLSADAVCHLSGVCAGRFHQHDEGQQQIEVRPMGGVGVLPVVLGGDDVPCKLCEQLVDHLRDVLIANTTELEFKQVLEGLCKQTKGFADECNSLVEQYYREIYETLVHNLNSSDACFMIGVCPKGSGPAVGPIMPLLPVAVAEQHERDQLEREQKKSNRRPLLGENEPVLSAVEIAQAQLPIDRLMGAPSSMRLVENGKFCTICEYFMHFVQEALSEPANEDEIKQAVSGTCNRLPSSIRAECRSFVDVYGDAVIALLVQSMDPRQVCPTMRLCPAANDDIEVFAPGTQVVDVTIDAHAGGDKPTCPLCLFAVSQLEESVKTDRSKDNIKSALGKLCTHLSPKLRLECSDFVDTYTAELVEMLASDFTPQEICVFLKLCVDQRPDLSLLGMELDYYDKRQQQGGQAAVQPPAASGDVETNEIPDITVNGQITIDHVPMVSTPECLVCEEMVKEVEKRIKNKKSKQQIKDALEHACDRLRKYRTKCEKYIDQHSDQIIDLMMKELSPKEICHTLAFCIGKEVVDELDVDEALLDYVVEPPAIVEPAKELLSSSDAAGPTNGLEKNQPPQCAICEFVMVKLEADLADKKTRSEIENAVRSVCSRLPNTVAKQCSKLIDQYGDFIIKLLQTLPPEKICTKLSLCVKEMSLLEQSECKRRNGFAANLALEIVECGVCQGTVSALDDLLASEKLEDQVAEYADRICNELPAKHYAQCDRLLSVYGISMLQQLRHSIEREQVCVNIDLCSEMMQIEGATTLMNPPEFASLEESDEGSQEGPVGRKSAFLLGSNQCSWGPAYWCKSVAAAEECKSKDYCMERKLGIWSQ